MPRTMLTSTGPTLGSPRWAGDYLDRDHLVPGGARLDAAQFAADANGVKYVQSGTIIGRSIAERDAGTGFGPAADTDDEIFLVAFDISDAAKVEDVELYRQNSVVYENFLPAFAAASAAVKAALRDRYVCTINVA